VGGWGHPVPVLLISFALLTRLQGYSPTQLHNSTPTTQLPHFKLPPLSSHHSTHTTQLPPLSSSHHTAPTTPTIQPQHFKFPPLNSHDSTFTTQLQTLSSHHSAPTTQLPPLNSWCGTNCTALWYGLMHTSKRCTCR
jgi:hypothetical protein